MFNIEVFTQVHIGACHVLLYFLRNVHPPEFLGHEVVESLLGYRCEAFEILIDLMFQGDFVILNCSLLLLISWL